jgi:hypothetical protein
VPIPVRVVTVSPELHATVEAGTGEFILITNGDVVLYDAVFRALALRRLVTELIHRRLLSRRTGGAGDDL